MMQSFSQIVVHCLSLFIMIVMIASEDALDCFLMLIMIV